MNHFSEGSLKLFTPQSSSQPFNFYLSSQQKVIVFVIYGFVTKDFSNDNKFLLTVIQSQFMWELCLEYCNLLSKEEQTAVFLSDPDLPKLLFVSSCVFIMPSKECYRTLCRSQFYQVLQCVSQFKSFYLSSKNHNLFW